MRREFENMHQVPLIAGKARGAGAALQSQGRLGSFGSLPFTIGSGKKAKTWQPPTIDAPGFDGQPTIPPIGEKTKTAATVDLSAQGSQAGAQFVNGLNAELDRGIAEASAKIEKLKAMMNFSASPTLRINVPGGGGLGGLNPGRGMGEVR